MKKTIYIMFLLSLSHVCFADYYSQDVTGKVNEAIDSLSIYADEISNSNMPSLKGPIVQMAYNVESYSRLSTFITYSAMEACPAYYDNKTKQTIYSNPIDLRFCRHNPLNSSLLSFAPDKEIIASYYSVAVRNIQNEIIEKMISKRGRDSYFKFIALILSANQTSISLESPALYVDYKFANKEGRQHCSGLWILSSPNLRNHSCRPYKLDHGVEKYIY